MLDDGDRTYTMEEIEQETGFDRRTIAYYVQEGLLPKVGRRGPRTRYPRHYLDRLLFIKKVRDLQDRGRLGNYTLEDIREIFVSVPERMIADIVAGREPLEAAPKGRASHARAGGSLRSPSERIEQLRRISDVRRSREPEIGSRRARRSESPWRLELAGPPRTTPPDRPGGALDAERESPAAAASMDDDEAALFLDLDMPHRELMVRRVVEDLAELPASPPRVERRAKPPASTLARMLAQLDAAAGRRSRTGHAEEWTRAEITPDIAVTVRGLDEDSTELLERIARVLRGMIAARRTR